MTHYDYDAHLEAAFENRYKTPLIDPQFDEGPFDDCRRCIECEVLIFAGSICGACRTDMIDRYDD